MQNHILFSPRVPGVLGAGLGREASRCRQCCLSAAGMQSRERRRQGETLGWFKALLQVPIQHP